MHSSNGSSDHEGLASRRAVRLRHEPVIPWLLRAWRGHGNLAAGGSLGAPLRPRRRIGGCDDGRLCGLGPQDTGPRESLNFRATKIRAYDDRAYALV